MEMAGEYSAGVHKLRITRKAFAGLNFPDMELKPGAVSLEVVDGKRRAVMYRLCSPWLMGKPGDGLAFVFERDGSVLVVIESKNNVAGRTM